MAAKWGRLILFLHDEFKILLRRKPAIHQCLDGTEFCQPPHIKLRKLFKRCPTIVEKTNMIRPSSLVSSGKNYIYLSTHDIGNTENNLKNGEESSKNASSSLTRLNDQSRIHQNENQAKRDRISLQRLIATNAVASSSNSHGNGNSNIDEISNGHPRLPKSVQNEIHEFDHGSLKKVPVYFANKAIGGHYATLALGAAGIRVHGYVIAGQPGKGRKSGAILYKVGEDPKRGEVDINSCFIGKARLSSGENKFNGHVLSALDELRGTSYSSKEEFHRAYREVRTRQESDIQKIDEEFKKLSILTPKSKMEMWLKQANGYDCEKEREKPNKSEQDIRAFEEYNPKNKIQILSLKPVPNVRSTDLLEVKREFLLQRLYIDDRHGRRGTGMQPDVLEYDPDDNRTHPANLPIPQASAEERQRLASLTPTYKLVYPFPDETFANCNAGNASLLQRAMNRYPNEQERGQPKKANFAGFGVGHRMKMWEPLPSSKDSPAKEVSKKVDTASSQSWYKAMAWLNKSFFEAD